MRISVAEIMDVFASFLLYFVAMIAIDHMGGNKLMEEPRDDLDSNEARHKTAQ